MCGIAGFVGFDNEPLLQAMCASLQHRGPDESGFYRAAGIGLAMRRLAVIDLATGQQPIANETRDIWVVFNGEIYNYQDLTAELKRLGHTFSTRSDTETIVHLYEEYGLEFVSHLRGMFAIALWDANRRRLVLVRDRIGEKPLFYMVRGERLYFGSEIKAILQAQHGRRVDHQAICDYLAVGYVPAPRTAFADIRKLPPAHMLIHEHGQNRVQRYWDRQTSGACSSFVQAAARLEDLLLETTSLCLKSDVEVGAFLSGGLDSSLIAAMMRHHGAHVKTFTVGYRGQAEGFNELSYARSVAERLGTDHHELILEPGSSAELLPRILWHYDEPHAEPTSVLVYLLCEFTRRSLKVAVGGTGGDELCFGYPRHAGIRMLQYYQMLPKYLREQVLERLILRWPESTRGSRFAKRAKRFVAGSRLSPEMAYRSWVSLVAPTVREHLLSRALQDVVVNPVADECLLAYLSHRPDRHLLDRAADLDVGAYLPEYQLAYMDRMSMAHGLEVRSPFCDFRLAEFVTSQPASYRLKGLRSKHILKHIGAKWVSAGIANRRKVGFDSPIGQWFKDELRGFLVGFLSRDNLQKSGLLNPDSVEVMIADHLSGNRDYSLQLWALLALEAWYRMYIEDGITSGAEYSLHDLRGASGLGFDGRLPSATMPVRQESHHAETLKVASRRGSFLAASKRMKLWNGTPDCVRGLLSPVVGILPPSAFLGRRYRKTLSKVRQAQFDSRCSIRQAQVVLLRRICELAYKHSSYYRTVFEAAGFTPACLKSVDDLMRLPTIDRNTVCEQAGAMCAMPPGSAGVDCVSTGGTGGMPLRFHINDDRSITEYAYLVASWERCGYTMGMPMVVLRGRTVRRGRTGLYHEYDPILRHHYYSTFHMTDDSMARYVEHIRGIGPCFLHVYPSSLDMLVRFLLRSGIKPPLNIRGIIAESETIYPNQRRRAEGLLGCRYFSCYGHTEKLVLAAECEHSTDYHVWPTYGYFELLNSHGRPITTPGERGEIVGTGFINTVTPFIRYRTGDYATYVGSQCGACGRHHPVIRDICGHRVQEMLIAVDGTEVPWTALNMHDDTFINVRQFQFYQDRPGYAVLRLVPAKAFGETDTRRIEQNLGHKLAGRLRFDIQTVDSIPLSPRGKAIYVDQRIRFVNGNLESALAGP